MSADCAVVADRGFQASCESLRPDLLRFALWLSHDRSLAEDVVQESLLRAWKARHALLDEGALKSWLLTIIRREYARTFERKNVVTVDVTDLAGNEESELSVSQDEGINDLRAALERLPSEYRRPLLMQVQLGYSTAEIARELRLSRPAVLTRLYRARMRLKKELSSA
jgi:RNA polymerase sigma-70 factor, ECF subfamily